MTYSDGSFQLHFALMQNEAKNQGSIPFPKNYGLAFIHDQSHFAVLHSLIAPVKVLPCFSPEME